MKNYIVLGVVGFFGLLTLLGSYGTVDYGHRGVMITMGKTSQEVLGEGPHFKLPFISQIKQMSIRIHKSQDESTAATKDLQRVDAVFALNWTVNPESVGKMLREVGDETSIEKNIIAPAVSEVLKASTAKLTAEEVLTRREELKTEIDDKLVKRLTTYGLIVKDISLVDFNFTQEFNKAVENKQIAEQRAKQASYEAERATQDAKAAVEKAKGEGQAALELARGQAKAQELLRSNLTSEILQAKAIEKWDGVYPQVMSGGTLPFINISLNKKQQEGK